MSKKVYVNENCIGCGVCTAIASAVFALNSDGFAENVLGDVPEDLMPSVEEAASSCPTQAIVIEK